MSKSFYKEEALSDSERLIPEMLRSFPGCEHYNDEEAEEVRDTLGKLANILYDIHMQRNYRSSDKANLLQTLQ